MHSGLLLFDIFLLNLLFEGKIKTSSLNPVDIRGQKHDGVCVHRGMRVRVLVCVCVHPMPTFPCTFVQVLGTHTANQMAATNCIWASRCSEDYSVIIRMATKRDLSDYECSVAVCARQAFLSISETADRPGSLPFTESDPKKGSDAESN